MKLNFGIKIPQKYFNLGSALIIFFAIGSFIINLWQINKGLIMNDEGYYLFLLKDLPTGLASNFHLLFKNIFKGDIVVLRLAVVLVNLICAAVYSYGIYKFYKKDLDLNKSSFLTLWSLAFISLFGVSLVVFSYINLNQFILQISTGLLLIGVANNNIKTRNILIILSGFMMGFLFFIMITNVPLILLNVILIYLISEKGKGLKDSLLFLVGVLMSFLVYFLFFDSITDFFNSFIQLFFKAKAGSGEFSGTHGLTPLILWSISTVRFLIMEVFVGVLFLYGLDKIIFNKSTDKVFSAFVLLITVLLLLFYIKYVFINSTYGISPSTPFIILFVYSLFVFKTWRITKLVKNELYFIIFIATIPFLLSFGTNVEFKVRVVAYLCFWLPLVFINILKSQNKNAYYFVFLVVISFYFIYNISNLGRTNWGGIVYTEQKFDVKDLGINQKIKLDETKFKTLESLKLNIKEGDFVILGDPSLWGYAYLLNASPISYDFKCNSELMLEKLTIVPNTYQGKGIKCICVKDKPFDDAFLENVKLQISADSILITELEWGQIYLIK